MLGRALIWPLVLAALLLLATDRDAAARGPGKRGAERARALFAEGYQHLSQRRVNRALFYFLRSMQIVPRHSTVLNVAQCYRLLGRPAKALEHYRDYLATWRAQHGARPAPYQREVNKHIRDLSEVVALAHEAKRRYRTGDYRGALSRLQTARERLAWSELDLLAAHCQLKLGRREAARRLAERALSAYRHQIDGWTAHSERATMPDIERHERRIGEIERLLASITTRPAPSPTEPKLATVIANGLPADARVLVDGEVRGHGPAATLAIEAGAHEIAIQARGFEPWKRQVELVAGQRIEQRIALQRKRERCTTCLVLGISTATLAVGAEVLALVFASKANELYTNDPSFDDYRTVNVVGHISAGVLAAGALLSFYLYFRRGSAAPNDDDGSQPTIEGIGAAPTRGGAMLSGAFRF